MFVEWLLGRGKKFTRVEAVYRHLESEMALADLGERGLEVNYTAEDGGSKATLGKLVALSRECVTLRCGLMRLVSIPLSKIYHFAGYDLKRGREAA